MINKKLYIFMLAGLVAFSACDEGSTPDSPPLAKQINKELTIHGDTRVDPYYWLNERENPEVISYLEAENAWTESQLAHTEPLQETLYQEIVGRIKQDDASVPYKKHGFYYYTRYEEGKEYPIYCRKRGSMDTEEEILLDVNTMAEGYDYYNVRGLNVSPSGTLLAFAVDTVSRRKYTLHFKDLINGEILPDAIPNTTGSAAWANDNKTVFYTQKDKALRAYKIFKHKLGTDAAQDRMVFHEADDTFGTTVYTSKSQKYIMIACYSTLSNEYRFLDADNPDGDFSIIQPRERDLEYSAWHYGDHFYIITNKDARNFKLVKTAVKTPRMSHWQDVLPHREDVLVEDIEIFKDFLVVDERQNGLTRLRVMSWDGKQDGYIEFDDPAYAAGISRNPEFNSQLLRYGYSSLTTPYSVYDVDMQSGEKTLLKRDEVVGDFAPENYVSERLYAEARDGTKVPVSLVYHKSVSPKDNNSLLLYAYGSYGYSRDANFSSVRLSLLDRGFIYAIAHIRGGQELGRQWYEDGKMFNKINTFTDFIDCGKFLVAEGYTSADKLFARGGSAGGLLMGAVVNMQPDLFKGVIAAVPFVDVVTTMLDESIPLTTGEYDEWGNPNNKDSYDYMLSYSPYDQVSAQDYPALLVTTGLHDSQVQYWEPAKWVAKLRATKTDNNPLLLSTDMEAGHSGASGRFKRYRETALEYAFLLDLAGISK